MSEKKIFKPNVAYVIEIHGCQYYVGCHCSEKELSKSRILKTSGNPLFIAYRKKLITYSEYRENCKLVHIEEYDSKEEALSREAELIKKFKEHYGSQCLNKSDGNIFGGTKGVLRTEKVKKKLSDSNRNNPKQNCKPVRQYTKDGQFVKEYPSLKEASRQTGIQASHIGYVISKTPVKHYGTGKYYICESAGGYLWESA